jgi:hypothetical protein
MCNIELCWCAPNSQFRLGDICLASRILVIAGGHSSGCLNHVGLRHETWLRVRIKNINMYFNHSLSC